MSRWAVYCLVCERTLWTMPKPFRKGEVLALRSDMRHGTAGTKPAVGDLIQWCLCKGGIAQQEVFENDQRKVGSGEAPEGAG